MMHRFLLSRTALFAFVMIHWAGFASAQDTKLEKTENSFSTIKGKIEQSNDEKMQILMGDLKLRLTEFVLNQMPQPPLPDDWQDLTNEDRTDWLRKYEGTKQGQKLIQRRKKILDDAATFDITVEDDGHFVVYDVPPGTFDLRGDTARTVDGIEYFLEIAAQINVQEKVDEILLAPIKISVTPVFKQGDPSPKIDIESFDKESNVTNQKLDGQFAFLSFWSKEESQPSVDFIPIVQTMYKELKGRHPIRLLSICLDKKRTDSLDFIKQQKMLGWHGFAGSWEHPTVQAFGVRALPYFCLLDPDGKILMTHQEIRQAYSTGKKLEDFISERIENRD